MNVLSTMVAHDFDGHMWGGGWMWLWGGLMMLFWIGAIALVVWLVIRGTHGEGRARSSARHILDERYARGEIDTEEYEQRASALR